MECINCPQYNRVCNGIVSDKKYCFFYHGNKGSRSSKEQTIQFNDLFELINLLIKDNADWINQNKFTLDNYGKDYFILILYPKDIKDGKHYPIGYVYIGGNNEK